MCPEQTEMTCRAGGTLIDNAVRYNLAIGHEHLLQTCPVISRLRVGPFPATEDSWSNGTSCGFYWWWCYCCSSTATAAATAATPVAAVTAMRLLLLLFACCYCCLRWSASDLGVRSCCSIAISLTTN